MARFSTLGVPAVNYGPGNPHLAHKQEEFVLLAQIRTWRSGCGLARAIRPVSR